MEYVNSILVYKFWLANKQHIYQSINQSLWNDTMRRDAHLITGEGDIFDHYIKVSVRARHSEKYGYILFEC